MPNSRLKPLASRFPEADRVAASRWGVTAVAVIDAATGEAYGNEFARLPIRSASIIKVPILMAVLADHALSDAEKADAEKMIRRSDNDATSRFWRAYGQKRCVEWVQRAAGTRDTVLAPENPNWWGYTLTTAADMAAVLAHLARPGGSPLVTPPNREYILSEMRSVVKEQRWGLPAARGETGGDADAVAVKNGWYPEEESGIERVHTIGLAPVGKDATRAVVAVLTRYPKSRRFAYGRDTCQAVCAALLRRF